MTSAEPHIRAFIPGFSVHQKYLSAKCIVIIHGDSPITNTSILWIHFISNIHTLRITWCIMIYDWFILTSESIYIKLADGFLMKWIHSKQKANIVQLILTAFLFIPETLNLKSNGNTNLEFWNSFLSNEEYLYVGWTLYIDMFEFQNTFLQKLPGLNHCCIFVPVKKACKTNTDFQLRIE